MSGPTPSDFLDDLERRLESRSIGSPSPALKARVLGDVGMVLRSPGRDEGRTTWLAYAAGLAAVFVIGTTLSKVAISDTRFARAPVADLSRTRATASALRELAPELSETDALRLSVVDDARSGFICVPRLRPSGVDATRSMVDSNRGNP